MTPLHLEIALHYYVNGIDDFDPRRLAFPAVQAAILDMIDAGMLQNHDPRIDRIEPTTRLFEGTEGLGLYIEALLRLPWPQRTVRWEWSNLSIS